MSDGEETVEVPAEAARVAYRELGMLIDETDAVEEGGQPMTPTARIRERLVEELPHDIAVQAVDVVDAVAEERRRRLSAVKCCTMYPNTY